MKRIKQGVDKDPDQHQIKKEEVETIVTDKINKGQIDKGILIIIAVMIEGEIHITIKINLIIVEEDLQMIIKEVIAKKEANKGKKIYNIEILLKITINNSPILRNSNKATNKK